MSLEEAAKTVADQIRHQQFIEVYTHHDADGIAAAGILCHAMLRSGIRFRLRIRQSVTAAELGGDGAKLLCDLGSGMDDLPHEVMVVDHHNPLFDGDFHVNPRLAGIDGDRELSAAGTAYLVAKNLGDNRDLAGLVMAGILGDGQEIKGKNLEIFNEAVANSIITPGRGLTLPGRDMTERWYIATHPYLEGISGDESVTGDLIGLSKGDNGTRLDMLISLAVLKSAPHTSAQGLFSLYGDTFHLEREIIEDAHAFTAVIDACGKSGHGDIGAALCLRSSAELEQAWEITRQHHGRVIDAIRAAQPVAGSSVVYEIRDTMLAGDVADVLARDRMHKAPVLVYARDKISCRISARAKNGEKTDIGSLVHNLAASCGGTGGGHRLRAGATIPCDMIGQFSSGWQEAFTA